MQDQTLFTKIIHGDIPSHKIYEDEHTYAFLDIYPRQPGQVLVVPKAQIDHIWDLSHEDYHALMSTAKKVAQRLRVAFKDKERVAMIVEGLEVAHAHIKLFPFSTHEEFMNQPDMNSEPDHTALAELARSLSFS